MRFIFAGALASLLVTAQPALAEEETEDVALLAYLGLTAPDGKTTLGDKAGELEGYVLTSSMLKKVGAKIREDIGIALSADRSIEQNTRLVPLVGDQRLALTNYYMASSRLRALQMTASAELPSMCPPKRVPGLKGIDGGDGRIKGLDVKASDVVGAFKSNTEIKGYSIDPGTQLVVNATTAEPVRITGEGKLDWVLPDELGIVGENSGLLRLYGQVLGNATEYVEGKCNKAYVDQAKAIVAATKTLSAPGEKGAPSLLESAMLLEGLFAGGSSFRVLRVDVEKAGGSLTNRSNIWTTLGFNGVFISGGMIVTYRLIDPATGAVRQSNTLICHHPRRSLGQVAKEGASSNQGVCTRASEVS